MPAEDPCTNNAFQSLMSRIKSCQDCADKFGFDPIPIVQGHPHAKIMQISQAPGQAVHLTQKPFNDQSGKKLKTQWYQMSDETFYNPRHFYITAMAHCFPGKHPKGGDNPPPMACAKKWLHQEMALVHNQMYVIIGKKAADFLFPGQDYLQLIFNDQQLHGKLAVVLPHPSPLNVRWFKAHPTFEAQRVPVIRQHVRDALGMDIYDQ